MSNPSILKLDFNERSDKLNPLVKKFSYGDSLWQYPNREPLEKRISEIYDMLPNQVLCTNGGDEAIMILMRIIKEGSENGIANGSEKNTGKLILPLPAFSQYTWGVKSWKLDCLTIDSKDDLGIDIKLTLAAIKNNAGCITILTRPNNPSGELIPFNDLLDLITAAKLNNGWIFLDEAYIEFSEEKSVAFSLLKQFDNLVILRTFSKAYGLAGIRLGYILGCEKLINEFRERCAPFNIPSPSIKIALEALDEKNQKEMSSYCQVIQRNREILQTWFKENEIDFFPSDANFILLRLPPNQAKAVKSFMAKNSVLLRDFNDSRLSDCLRMTIPYNLDILLPLLEQCFCPKLICLDMDGVLIDTSQSYDQCVIATVKKLSGTSIELSEIENLRKLGGYNNDWVLSHKLLVDMKVDCSLDEVTGVFQNFYLGNSKQVGLVDNESVIISESLIDKINKSNNKIFSIVTGRPRKEAESGQGKTNLANLDLISLDDVKVGKPSPEGIQQLQKKHSNLSWMCGDNPDDMQAAVASNSLAIGIGSNKVESLYDAGADIVLKNINELEAWL